MGSSSRRSHSKQSSEASWANRHSGNDRIGGATGSSSRRRPSSAGKVRGSPDQILAPHSPSQPPLTAAGSWCPSPSRLDLGAPSPSRPDLGPPLSLDECWWWRRLAMSLSSELRCQFCEVRSSSCILHSTYHL
jgi:hypothetical protein